MSQNRCFISLSTAIKPELSMNHGGGGGLLGLEKGTDCGPTAAEQWLLQPKMAKKRGLSSYHIV